ncbi:MAG: hypothetical protein ACPKPY_11725 [Nitrososphaeraceae archaeon]
MNNTSKHSFKQICNGFGCNYEASEQVTVLAGNKEIILKVCKKCLPNFQDEHKNT